MVQMRKYLKNDHNKRCNITRHYKKCVTKRSQFKEGLFFKQLNTIVELFYLKKKILSKITN